LAKDPTETVEFGISLLLRKFSLAEEACQQLHLQGSRLLRLYDSNIHKEGVCLRPVMSNIVAPTYQLSKHVTGMLIPLMQNLPLHVKKSTKLIHMLKSLQAGLKDMMISLT
jgi:hypothetical protein